jgi:hypothetical protein
MALATAVCSSSRRFNPESPRASLAYPRFGQLRIGNILDLGKFSGEADCRRNDPTSGFAAIEMACSRPGDFDLVTCKYRGIPAIDRDYPPCTNQAILPEIALATSIMAANEAAWQVPKGRSKGTIDRVAHSKRSRFSLMLLACAIHRAMPHGTVENMVSQPATCIGQWLSAAAGVDGGGGLPVRGSSALGSG